MLKINVQLILLKTEHIHVLLPPNCSIILLFHKLMFFNIVHFNSNFIPDS